MRITSGSMMMMPRRRASTGTIEARRGNGKSPKARTKVVNLDLREKRSASVRLVHRGRNSHPTRVNMVRIVNLNMICANI